MVEGLDEAEAELFALLVARDCDVFDVADCSEGVNATPFVLAKVSFSL